MSDRTYTEDEELEVTPAVPSLVPTGAAKPVGAARYELGRELGRGGMGRVVEAQDRQFDRPVAVKLLLGQGTQARARFEAEARVTAQLDHPAIPGVHELGKLDDGTPFYAMHLARGRTLEAALVEAPTLEDRLRHLPVLIQVAQALAAAHEVGVVHRDVKPQNVIVGSHGRAFLLDWGIAKVRSAIGAPGTGGGGSATVEDGTTRAAHTLQGSVMGTPAYMAPEQARGDVDRIDARTDVFALGAILYHLLTGRCPYPADTAAQALVAAVETRWEPLERAAPTAPPGLSQICARAMAPDPADRFRDAGDMAAALECFLSTAVMSQPDSRVERFATATTIVASLLVLGLSTAVWASAPGFREQGGLAWAYVSMSGMGVALAAVDWRTAGRYRLTPLILVFAMLTLLFGISATTLGVGVVLAAAQTLEGQPEVVVKVLLMGVWEALGCLPTSAALAAIQLLAWGVLRRRTEI